MNSQNKISSIILYTTSMCNLNCSYCYIDKNPALKSIDKILEDSFNDDMYYINFIKKIIPDKNQLHEIQLWGGEPTLHLERAFNTIKNAIKEYPNFNKIMFSTNFIGDYWFNTLETFFNIFKEFPNRYFEIDIQLSIDGPPLINDLGRGKNVTEKFLNNLKILIKKIKNVDWIPENITLIMHFKPTLSNETIPLLQTKEDVLNYYQFFDKITSILKYYEYNNFKFLTTLPNTATPSQHTKLDGQKFANFCKICRELEKENKEKKYFNIYKEITPFTRNISHCNLHERSLTNSCSFCGTGIFTLGLLPEEKISLCHSGFVDLINDYKQYCLSEENKNHSIDKELFRYRTVGSNGFKIICTLEEYEKQKPLLECFLDPKSTYPTVQLIGEIQNLASNNLIDKKYIDFKEALYAAKFLHTIPYCIRDSIGVVGSIIVYPMGLLKLLLNGAMEYIINE